MLENAQKLARTMNVPDLIERLSNGFTISRDSDLTVGLLFGTVFGASMYYGYTRVSACQDAKHELALRAGARPAMGGL